MKLKLSTLSLFMFLNLDCIVMKQFNIYYTIQLLLYENIKSEDITNNKKTFYFSNGVKDAIIYGCKHFQGFTYQNKIEVLEYLKSALFDRYHLDSETKQIITEIILGKK